MSTKLFSAEVRTRVEVGSLGSLSDQRMYSRKDILGDIFTRGEKLKRENSR